MDKRGVCSKGRIEWRHSLRIANFALVRLHRFPSEKEEKLVKTGVRVKLKSLTLHSRGTAQKRAAPQFNVRPLYAERANEIIWKDKSWRCVDCADRCVRRSQRLLFVGNFDARRGHRQYNSQRNGYGIRCGKYCLFCCSIVFFTERKIFNRPCTFHHSRASNNWVGFYLGKGVCFIRQQVLVIMTLQLQMAPHCLSNLTVKRDGREAARPLPQRYASNSYRGYRSC